VTWSAIRASFWEIQLVLTFVSKSASFCSHLNAGLRMLVHWFESAGEVKTVRALVCWSSLGL